MVAFERALGFSHAHGDHLEQPALNLAGEIRVRLDPVQQHDAIGFPSEAVHVDLKTLGGRSQGNRLHG